ncbi:MAG: microcin C ABC transporter permease YejB [Myxococcota bacterium]
MGRYILRRLMLIPPTLFGIMALNFIIVQAAPGGPVEQILAQLTGEDVSTTARIGGSAGGEMGPGGGVEAELDPDSAYTGSRGIDPELIKELERQFGFDRPMHERFFQMLWNYLRFDFGDSFYQDVPVVQLVIQRMPVSISLGVWTLLLVYSISIPLGIAKAVRDGTRFDLWTSVVIFTGYAVPAFLFAILLVILFAGGSFLEIFPLGGLTSENWYELSFFEKIKDYLWHMALPVASLVIGGFATLSMLTKNSFLEEINKQFVTTARSKGITEQRVLYGHVFRNAMLIVIAAFPSALIGILFTGALLVEVIFGLNGLGLLGFNAALQRDFPVLFGTLYCFTLLGLVMHLIGDLTYVLVDPRIDFESREV